MTPRDRMRSMIATAAVAVVIMVGIGAGFPAAGKSDSPLDSSPIPAPTTTPETTVSPEPMVSPTSQNPLTEHILGLFPVAEATAHPAGPNPTTEEGIAE